MRREGENIVIPVRAVVAIVGALISGGGIGAYGVTAASASHTETIHMQLAEIKRELCEIRNDRFADHGLPVRNCGR